MSFKDRLDEQIAARAPWMTRPGRHFDLIRSIIRRNLSYYRTIELADQVEDWPGRDIMDRMGREQAACATATGLENIPREGGAMIVANHPTGIGDGVALWHLLAPIRPDMFIYANSDITRVVPQLTPLFAPVEWREDKRTREKTRATLQFTRDAMEAGRIGIIFPSGRLAKRRGLKLYERPWMPSAAMIARKFDVPLIPVNIQSRNSNLFYVFDKIHPTLRDITLFHEMLNKSRQPFIVTVGEPIHPRNLPKDNEEAIQILRKATLALGGRDAPEVSLPDVTPRPSWAPRKVRSS